MLGHNPPDIWQPKQGISHAVAAGSGRQIFVTGQIAFDEQRRVVGKGDVGRQMEVCIAHVERILDGFGGGVGDVVSLTVFYTDPGQLDAIRAAWAATFEATGTAPACVMIQVAGLINPDLLVELIPTVVVPEERFRVPQTDG
ncbi:MAG: RidA family protein [Pseudomonadota bacterium]